MAKMSDITEETNHNQVVDELLHEEVTVIDNEDYQYDLDKHFYSIPVVARPVLDNAKQIFCKIEKMLYSTPAFIELVKASVTEQAFQAILTDDQKSKLATGALKLMTKKDGSLMANLINPKTNKVVSTISLKSVTLAPALSDAMTNYATQMQMAQIAEQIQQVQLAIEEVRQGQEYDRLATAYSCQQKLLQANEIMDPEIRISMLLRLAADAEDSRNLLMLSQKANVEFIREQPESFWGKIVKGADSKQIGARMNEIRDSLSAVNMVSLTEAIAYQEMGENNAARKSLEYYADFIQNTYLSIPGFVERMDSIDPSPEKYWSKNLPEIIKDIHLLPCSTESKRIGETIDEKTDLL